MRQVTAVRERLFDFSLADNGRAVVMRSGGELVTLPVDVRGERVKLASPNGPLLAAHETRDGVELDSRAWIVTAFR